MPPAASVAGAFRAVQEELAYYSSAGTAPTKPVRFGAVSFSAAAVSSSCSSLGSSSSAPVKQAARVFCCHLSRK